ncbi:hypothetical protein [Arthrobacter sp. LAPM80]
MLYSLMFATPEVAAALSGAARAYLMR